MKIRIIPASEVAALGRDVRTGGGTVATEALQAALDEALAVDSVAPIAARREQTFSRAA